jgi:hypothetical protein
MSCEEIKKLLTKYVQHTANEEEIKKVEEHLCVCHDCRTSLGQLMDKLDESEDAKISKNEDKQDEKEDDFEIIPSGEPSDQNLEKPQENQLKQEKDSKEESGETEQDVPEPEEIKEPKEEPKKTEETMVEGNSDQSAEEDKELEEKESKAEESYEEDQKEDQGQQEEDTSKEDVEYFPAEGIKTFSENEPKPEEDEKENLQEEEAKQGSPELQEDLSIRSALDSLSEDRPEQGAEKEDDLTDDLESAQEEFQSASENKRKKSTSIHQDTNIPSLEEGSGMIGYVSVVIGALVLGILIFLLIQG